MRVLRWLVIYNLQRIKMTLAVWKDWSWEEGEPEVRGLGEADESEGQVEEWAE